MGSRNLTPNSAKPCAGPSARCAGELATDMARNIENRLDNLGRLLSQLERSPAADVGIKQLVDKAKNEIAHIAVITGNAIALQLQHDSWKKK
jgi:hypothetical protein